jgi:hypothetical protein
MMRAIMAANEMGGPGANTVALRSIFQSRYHLRMIRQPQIIVAAEGQQRFVANADLHALRGLKHQALTIEVLFAAQHQIFFQWLHEKKCGLCPHIRKTGMGFRRESGYVNKVALLAALARLGV